MAKTRRIGLNLSTVSRVAVGAALVASAWAGHSRPSGAQPPGGGPAVAVVVSPVVERELANSGRTFLGTVVPLRKSVVGSAVDGRVVDVPYKRGDRVAAGKPVALLLTKTIEIEIAAAQAELAARAHALEELENGARPEEKVQARSRLLAAQAANEFAQAKYLRWKRLYESSRAVSQEDLEDALNLAIAAEHAMAAAKAGNDLAEAGPRVEQIAQAKARALAQEEEVRRLEDRLEKYSVKAPYDCFVVAEHTERGAWLKSGDPIVEVVALDPIEVEVQVPEDFIVQLDPSAGASVTVSALPLRSFQAEVARVVPQADVRARTFPVIVRLPNPPQGEGYLLKAGLMARVTLAAGARKTALLVPKDALVLGGRQTMVYALTPAPGGGDQYAATPVPVEIGLAVGSLIEVTGPLTPGAKVVIEGNERLMPGATVRVVREKTFE
jgi:RND family efflux transporter MFP subunit